MNKTIVARIVACALAISLAAITGCAHKTAPVTDAASHPSVLSSNGTSAVAGAVARKDAAEEKGAREIAAPGAAEGDLQAQRPAVAGAAEATQTLETLYFNYDSSALSAEAREAAQRNFRLLNAKGELKVRLEGHCDERGSDEYNLALGERRAVAAKKYLETLGIAEDRLSTLSFGKERPALEGSTEDAWARNRRVEFVVDK